MRGSSLRTGATSRISWMRARAAVSWPRRSRVSTSESMRRFQRVRRVSESGQRCARGTSSFLGDLQERACSSPRLGLQTLAQAFGEGRRLAACRDRDGEVAPAHDGRSDEVAVQCIVQSVHEDVAARVSSQTRLGHRGRLAHDEDEKSGAQIAPPVTPVDEADSPEHRKLAESGGDLRGDHRHRGIPSSRPRTFSSATAQPPRTKH